MDVLNLIDLFSSYVLNKRLTLTYCLVTNLDKFSLSLSTAEPSSSEHNKLLIYRIPYYN